jgi:type II secretory pathway predicted ATPase ExeA
MQKSSDNRYDSQSIENMDTDFISVECLEKLGLDQNPFIDHARDPFLFVDKQLEMSMNVLIDYLLKQNSTIVLLGEVGIGKTTHLRMLLRKGYEQFNFCTLRAKPKITFAEIEEKIKERWRLPHLSNEDVTTDEHIKKYIKDDKQPVLIIDDAHRLQINVLDELLKLKHYVGLQSPKAMGLVLASEPDLKTQLAELEQTNPAATQIYQINVRSFDANQCEEYIQYRMNKAGVIADSSFSSEKVTEIYSRSKGLPKLINKLAREEISKMCEQNVAAIGTANKLKSNPSVRLGLILGGLIAIAALLAVLSKYSNETNETVTLDIDKPEIAQNNTSLKTKDKQTSPEHESKPKNTTIAKPYVAPLVLGPLQEDKNDAKDAADTMQQTRKETIVGKPKITETTKQNKTPDTTKATTKASPYSSDWILKQDPNAYMIQIVASPNENNLIDFAKTNSLKDDTAYYRKSSADKIWFILVHGVYASRDEALKSIEQLSDTLKKNTPYPIQIKYLQEIIRQQ